MPTLRCGFIATLALLAISVPRLVAAGDEAPSPDEMRRGYRARTLVARPKDAAVADATRLAAGETAAGVRLRRALPHVHHLRVIELTREGDEPREAAKRLLATGLYDYVELDYLAHSHAEPSDPRLIDQWHLRNTGQLDGKVGADISAIAAWDTIKEAPDVIVAVIDSGVRLSHEDLRDNLWVNPGESGGGKETDSVDNDGDGYIDDLNGINVLAAVGSRTRGSPFDDAGHGSHVSGLIGAVGNNGVGGTGVAWKVKIMPLKFLNSDGTGSSAGAIECINYAVAHGAKVMNGSFGMSGNYSQAMYDALAAARDAGVIYVGSAGNDSVDIELSAHSPQSVLLDNLVFVANTTRTDELAASSSYGSGLVDLGAPGTDIFSLGIASDSDYRVRTGTSMASPIVAGAIALLRARYPDDSPRLIINRLLNAVDPLPSLDGKVASGGRLNLARALLPATSTRPVNDSFARRIALSTGTDSTARGSTLAATGETGEPVHLASAPLSGSIWWSWTPKSPGRVTIDTSGSTGDTVLAIYTGATLATLTRVAANDDATDGTITSSVDFDALAGVTYSIAVATKTPAAGAFVALHLSAIPANDAFAGAKLLAGVGFQEIGDPRKATHEAAEALFAGKARGRSLWYRWVAPATRNYQVSVTSLGDPIVGIYTGSSLTNLTQIVTDDDSGYATDSYAEFNATAGVTYYIAVDTALNGLTAPFRLALNDADWQFAASPAGFISSAPGVGPDGTLYLFDETGFMFAINPDGTRKWRTSATAILGASFQCTPAVGPDGTIYVCDYLTTTSGNIYAINPADGSRKWRVTTPAFNYGSPAVAADGTIYVKCNDGNLYAITSEGDVKWHYACGLSGYNSPVVGSDGTIYVTSFDTNLHAINPDGTRKWLYPYGVISYATPAIGADGTLYFANYLGRFYAVKPDGTERWTFDAPESVSGSAIVGPDGTVYFGSYDRNLYALDGTTGKKKWAHLCDGVIQASSPALAADGTVYVGDLAGLVYAVAPDGKRLRTFAAEYGIYGSPSIIGGKLIFGSYDTHLYSFDIGQNAAAGPWPMWRQNLRRIGRSTTPPGLPALTTPPATLALAPDSPATFAAPASATDATPLTYQWRFNGRALAGATNATLVLPSAQSADIGRYSVLVTGSGGSVVSAETTLSLTAVPTADARLINLAVRTTAGNGDKLLTVGLAVGGAGTSGPKPLLLRAVGPTLGVFGVPGVLADPKLDLFQGGSTSIATNDNWGGDPAVAAITPQVGAFALSSNASWDAALLKSLNAGSYTVQVSAATGDAGVALAEIYDATPVATFGTSTPRLINVSALTRVGTGGDALIAGFAIGGSGSKRILIRAIGPTLGGFGVGGTLVDPKLELYRSGGSAPISSNDNWGAAANAGDVSAAFTQVGAFALALDSKDAAMLVTLPTGSYTAQVSGLGTTPTGIALVEVYEVP